jgi:hypothetical protein
VEESDDPNWEARSRKNILVVRSRGESVRIERGCSKDWAVPICLSADVAPIGDLCILILRVE